MNKIKKAIIPIGGLGTRFLPLSKILPKELFPLVDRPVLQYIIEEAVSSGIEEIIFVTNPKKIEITDYLKKYFEESPELTKILEQRQKNKILNELSKTEEISRKVSFSQVIQKEPLGDGHALLQAKREVNGPIAALWGDDVVESETPCLLQLIKAYEKYQKPVIALCRIPKERLPYYGVAEVEKNGENTYKIKSLVEKPSIEEAPSNLAVVGKYILTPEVFQYLSEGKPGKGGEIVLSENLQRMIADGKEIIGCEIQGKWLECGNKQEWLKSHIYLSAKHPVFGPEIMAQIKEIQNESQANH
ncbi:MAG: sugar phosphate nucleotidyltransferase [Patescibacteria group bacterium]